MIGRADSPEPGLQYTSLQSVLRTTTANRILYLLQLTVNM